VTVRVVIAEDQAAVRAGFRSLLEHGEDIEVVGEAAHGDDAIRLASELRPDVILMDIRMPVLDGLEATRRIVADPELGNVRVVVLTTFEIDEYVFAALEAGASGFLVKDIEPEDLRDAVRLIAHGQALLAPSVTRRVIEAFTTPRPAVRSDSRRVDLLTDREREVVGLVADGLSNTEIAERLYISPLTAKTHVNRASLKLAARDRAQLVVIAYQTGLAAVRPAGNGRGLSP
jgi:DNA-binding NarL/FixJ family response regulator